MKALALFGRSREPVTYEVRLDVAPDIVSEYDDWLLDHVREMLAFPGFQSADVYRGKDLGENDRAVRVVVYHLRSRRELDSYLRTHAPRMRDEGVRRFGKQVNATRRILPTVQYALPEGLAVLFDEQAISQGLPICGNCHQPVVGRFCANCGQEDRTYLLSLRELVGEFFGELTNFDSRFFRSLKPLLFKPGWLTLEYIRGRRQNYFPPIRMYIIVSLLFFFVTAILADSGLDGANFENVVVNGEEPEQDSTEKTRDAIEQLEKAIEKADGFERQAMQVALDNLRRKAAEESGGTADTAGEPETREIQPTTADSAATPSDKPKAEEEPVDNGAQDEPAAADDFAWTWPSLQVDNGKATATGWGSEELNARMARGAESIKENPKAFVRTVIDNIPSMMFIFLPLIALALKFLYVFSRRYYIEHLMFSLHVHSAVFVILLFWMLLLELSQAVQWLANVMWIVNAVVWVYIPVYLYRALRCVYGQGHIMTSLKFFMLSIFYIIAASVTSVVLFVAAVYQQA